jgi:integrase
MRRFLADQRRRERDGLPSLVVKKPNGEPTIVSTVARCVVFNNLRRMLRDAMDTGMAEQIGLSREFIVTVPTATEARGRNARRPYPDEVARALADEDNLKQFAQLYDPHDLGLRDMWEIVVTTGRRVGEVVQVRWDCLGRYNGLPMFWHDQTKVGNYDVAIRIPERLYDVIAERQRKTLDRFTAHHGHRPATAERAGLALFPTTHRNHDGTQALSYHWFHTRFQAWITALDLGHCVAHQARHPGHQPATRRCQPHPRPHLPGPGQ